MTWTYVPADLATSQKDQVRLLIGDTDSAGPLVLDEEIDYAISVRISSLAAGAYCARAIAAKFSRLASTSADGISVSHGEKAQHYRDLARDLEAQAVSSGFAMPFAGGLTRSDVLTRRTDTSLVPALFQIGMDDNPPGSVDGLAEDDLP